MKILLSAYACDPFRGSEPAVGWNWAWHLAQAGHEVWVITRPAWQSSIEQFISERPTPNLHFQYVELRGFSYHHRIGGVYPHYCLWQWAAYRRARQLHRDLCFDLVHHVTLATVRSPSFMGHLGIPFIFGPLGGGDGIPRKLRAGFPARAKLQETLRDIANWLVRFDPILRAALDRATTVAVTSPQTRRLLPARIMQKAIVQLAAAGWNQESTVGSSRGEFTLAFVGLLKHWKGVHLALRAFADLRNAVPCSRFVIVGRGPQEQWLRQLATELAPDGAVTWVPWIERQRLLQIYSDFDVLIFPSLRDSGGMVVLEALSHGVPVVCLDLGGPGQIVNESCGCVVSTAGRSDAQVVKALAAELRTLAESPEELAKLKRGAVLRAREFLWSRNINRLYPPIETERGPGSSPFTAQ